MTNHQYIKPLWRSIAHFQRIYSTCKANRLISERSNDFLVSEQPLGVILDYQYCLALS